MSFQLDPASFRPDPATMRRVRLIGGPFAGESIDAHGGSVELDYEGENPRTGLIERLTAVYIPAIRNPHAYCFSRLRRQGEGA